MNKSSTAVTLGVAALSALLCASSAFADRLSEMIPPVSNPVVFEDPRAMSEIRPIFVYHEIDDKFVTGGGDVQVYALQARYAVNDRLAIIATKDGYVDFNPKAGVPKDEGFADIDVGLKYAIYQDAAAGEIFTAGFRYQIPLGDEKVFQGQGNGAFNPFVSAGKAFGDINVMAGTGFRIPVDERDSTFYDASLHVDYNMGGFYPLFEVNLFHVLGGGQRLPIKDEGMDFFNFGASDSDGETLVNAAAGFRAKLTDSVLFGAAYEFPMNRSAGTRIIDWRLTTDLVIGF